MSCHSHSADQQIKNLKSTKIDEAVLERSPYTVSDRENLENHKGAQLDNSSNIDNEISYDWEIHF